MCSFADKWTDEFLNTFVAPNIYCGIGIFSSIGMLAFDDQFSRSLNEGDKFKLITENFLIVNSRYLISNFDFISHLFTEAQSKLILDNLAVFTKFLTAHNLMWTVGMAKSALIGIFVRFLHYLVTKDKCDIDIRQFNLKMDEIEFKEKAENSIKIVNDDNFTEFEKEMVVEEMYQSCIMLRDSPDEFKIL